MATTPSGSNTNNSNSSTAKPTYNDDVGLPDIHYNPLQNYRNVTYNTRLTMMPASDPTKARQEQSYDYTKGIVMWETGGSGSVFMEEMHMDCAGTANGTGNYLTQMPIKWHGKMVEPLGGRFIESLSLSAMTLGYENNDAVYLFEIWFTGYNSATDMPETCKGWDGEELVFRWYTRLNKLEMKLDYRGGTYDFEMMPYGGIATYNDFYTLEEGFRMEGSPSTVGEFCTKLAKSLNDREKQKVDAGLRCIPHKYVITAHKDLTNLKFTYDFFSRHTFSWLLGNGEIQGTPGQSIQTFITSSMPNSVDMLKYLHRIPEKKYYNGTDTKNDTIHLPMRSLAIIPGCKDIEKNGVAAYDDKLGNTAKEVHYFLTSREDGLSTVSPQEYRDAETQTNRDKRVDNWIKKGMLRKVYKWIYTGENLEVINTNIKLDQLWRSVRPLWIDENGKPVVGASQMPPSQEKNGGGGGNSVKCDEAKMINPANTKKSVYYAEDMPFRPGAKENIAPKKGWHPHMPQFYHMNTAVQQKQEQGALSPENAQEYSIYRQVANGMAGTAEMFNITLDVVGDPYWLLQVPSAKGTPPWQDDVWEYEKSQLTEEQMSEKRKKTSTQTWLSFIYFEAQIPSANLKADDTMDIRRSDAISGVYVTRKITNSFVKGKFTTKLECVRDQLSNPWGGKPGSANDTNAGKGSASSAGPKTSAPNGTNGTKP